MTNGPHTPVMRTPDKLPPVRIPFFVPKLTNEDKEAVVAALGSRWLTGGPISREFEEAFAHYVGTKHAVAVSSCTAALHLAMRALKIRSGDEVIVPDLTFAATANAPLFCGAKPVFADIDEKTFNIDPNKIGERITPRTKAIIPVHYGGQPCDMKELLEIAEDNKLFVVEDCAHSLGAQYQDQQTGTFGIMGCFSFYPTKIITTLEGGMITTNDEEISKKLLLLREHGMTRTAIQRESTTTWFYDITDLGYNYRLTEAQAALGITQLKRVNEGIRQRIQAAKYYTDQLESQHFSIVTPQVAPNRSHIYHLYTIRIQKNSLGIGRDEVFKKLSDSGIQSSVHYTPLHMMSFYKQFLKNHHQFPVAERIYKELLSLPIYPGLTRRQIRVVATTIRKTLKKELNTEEE